VVSFHLAIHSPQERVGLLGALKTGMTIDNSAGSEVDIFINLDVPTLHWSGLRRNEDWLGEDRFERQLCRPHDQDPEECKAGCVLDCGDRPEERRHGHVHGNVAKTPVSRQTNADG